MEDGMPFKVGTDKPANSMDATYNDLTQLTLSVIEISEI